MAFVFEKNPTINDVIHITPQVFGDERGFFMETYNQKEFEDNGVDINFIQDSHSESKKGVFRGFHFQVDAVQAKLVRVVKGSVLDFAIDLRKGSPTYKKYVYNLISAENKKQVLIPKGFAHGFLSLEEGTELLYKRDAPYDPKLERGIVFNDPDLDINREGLKKEYDLDTLIISEKDKKNISLQDFETQNPF